MTELTVTQLKDMISDTNAFFVYLGALEEIEKAEGEPNEAKCIDAKRRILSTATRHLSADATRQELGLLFELHAKAVRINIAHRTAAFRARWGIVISGLPDIREEGTNG